MDFEKFLSDKGISKEASMSISHKNQKLKKHIKIIDLLKEAAEAYHDEQTETSEE
jgi:hypothetical protein